MLFACSLRLAHAYFVIQVANQPETPERILFALDDAIPVAPPFACLVRNVQRCPDMIHSYKVRRGAASPTRNCPPDFKVSEDVIEMGANSR